MIVVENKTENELKYLINENISLVHLLIYSLERDTEFNQFLKYIIMTITMIQKI